MTSTAPEVVGDGERGEEDAQPARHPVAEQGEDAEGEGDVGGHRHAPSPAAPGPARVHRRVERAGTTIPPSAAATGSAAERATRARRRAPRA
jgi:hypothetical protein